MPKDKKPYIELHDAHVTAALDDRSEQHFRWMMEQDRPELSTEDQDLCDKLEDSWKDEWEKVDRDWEPLVRGAAGASDIVEYQRRVEELKARREEILADRRKLFETQREDAAGNQSDDGALIQAARELLPKIKELWSLILAGNDNPLKLRTESDLKNEAIDILKDDPKKWLPIRREHVGAPSLYNTAPDRAGPIFERNLLSVVLESHGYSIRNKKQLLKEAKTTL